MSVKTFCRTLLFNIREERKVKQLFYQNSRFRRIDRFLGNAYILDNPYRIARNYNDDHNYYGETPLTLIHRVLSEIGCSSNDCFYDIGSGRGRLCFFIEMMFGCRVIGIELVDLFVKRAQTIVEKLSLKSLFHEKDFKQCKFEGATIIYMYGTCMSVREIQALCNRFKGIEKRAKIISVSYPLSDYDKDFEVFNKFKAVYPWGETVIYINQERRKE